LRFGDGDARVCNSFGKPFYHTQEILAYHDYHKNKA
jgi:hypothetical protein